MEKIIVLSIVIPVYNEEETLPLLYAGLNKELGEIRQALDDRGLFKKSPEIEILFIDDGSEDASRSILESFVKANHACRYIHFSRNFGHQPAVSAGMQFARGDAIVIMDGDLQDPPELIKEMVRKWRQGFDVVYAVRRKRQAKFFKKVAYKLYYKMKSLMSDHPVQSDAGDFSLLDRKVVDVINKFPEKDRYMRGLRAWVGFKQVGLEYDRPQRQCGKSKYSLSSLIKLAFQGITSTSVKPLFLSGVLSLLSIFIIIGVVFYVLLAKVYIPNNQMPKGWTSLMITITFLSGCQLVSIWLLSLYVARLFKETLSRPTFIVEFDSLAQLPQQTEGGDENR